jgi:hypothetical protein
MTLMGGDPDGVAGRVRAEERRVTGLADQNPSKSLVGGRPYRQSGRRIPAVPPPPAHRNKLGPGRGRPAVTGAAQISKPASACLPGDPVRPGPEDRR